MQKNLFNFLLEGEKAVHRPGEPLRIHAGQFLLIAGGNCLMTERLSVNNRYHSLLFFFDDSVLKDFFAKYPALPERTERLIGCGEQPVVSFETDVYRPLRGGLPGFTVRHPINGCCKSEGLI